MNSRLLACVILAAGQGTRMNSALPKVLHPVAGEPMVRHVIAACETARAHKIVTVVAPGMGDVEKAVAPYPCAIQHQPLGTGDAVKAALTVLAGFEGDVAILFGDTPLVTTNAILALQSRKKETNAALVVGGFLPDDPAPYGRLIMNGERITQIIEAADATPEQKTLTLCNGGIMLFEANILHELLVQLTNTNAKQEYYLTDCVALAAARGWVVSMAMMDKDDVRGVNTRVHLSEVEAIMQRRLREKHLTAGVTMTDPDSVFLCRDTELGRDVTIGPNVVFGRGVCVEDSVEIKAFCHIEGAHVRAGASIGPFARLRPDALIGTNAHIGNFVEIKKASVGAGAKINHLSYIGDAQIGEKTNIGAGTITCNYDGFTKAQTRIGAGAFVGSNTALVAPVCVGDGAIVGAGSVISKDVPAEALALSRPEQTHKDGWATLFRKSKNNGK